MITVALGLHILSALIWVGGMFFAIMILRLAAAELEPPVRAPLWGRVFAKFFPWVWISIILLPLTGYLMIFNVWGGFAGLPLYINLMHGLGLLMIGIYLHIWFAPYNQFRKALSAKNIPAAGAKLNQIRILVTVNLVIGLLVSVIGSTGRYW